MPFKCKVVSVTFTTGRALTASGRTLNDLSTIRCPVQRALQTKQFHCHWWEQGAAGHLQGATSITFITQISLGAFTHVVERLTYSRPLPSGGLSPGKDQIISKNACYRQKKIFPLSNTKLNSIIFFSMVTVRMQSGGGGRKRMFNNFKNQSYIHIYMIFPVALPCSQV